MSLEDKMQALRAVLDLGVSDADSAAATPGAAYPVISATAAQALAARWAAPDWMRPSSASAGGGGANDPERASGPCGHAPQSPAAQGARRPPSAARGSCRAVCVLPDLTTAVDSPDCDPQTLVHDILGAQALRSASRRVQRRQPAAPGKPSAKATPQDRFALDLSPDVPEGPAASHPLAIPPPVEADEAQAAPAPRSRRPGAPRP